MTESYTSLNPKITVHPKPKGTEELVVLDPVSAYMNGYFDASRDFYRALVNFVTTLRVTGWKDQDILKALLTALRNYSEGEGINRTSDDVLRTYSGKERVGVNGQSSRTTKL